MATALCWEQQLFYAVDIAVKQPLYYDYGE
jgi:hypothetical protein